MQGCLSNPANRLILQILLQTLPIISETAT